MIKQFPTLGCCGLDCGLCPSYYTDGSSRCPGCCGEDFINRHPPCSIINCCIKKRNLEVCAECEEYPCNKFKEEADETDIKTTSKRIMQNQNIIMELGIDWFMEQQRERMSILRTMLGYYNDGRSKTFYCLAATLLTLNSLNEALKKAETEVKDNSISEVDLKSKAKLLRSILNKYAEEENEDLKMRKKK